MRIFVWGRELLSHKTSFHKSTVEQVHIKPCKQSLNVPWYTENIAWRAELGRYRLLSIHIKASAFSYWQRLKCSTNVLLREAFQCATKYTPFFDIQQNEATQQHIKNAGLVKKKPLWNQYLQNWLENQNRSSTSSSLVPRTFTLAFGNGVATVQERNLHKRKLKIIINLKTTWHHSITKPPHRISLTRFRW